MDRAKGFPILPASNGFGNCNPLPPFRVVLAVVALLSVQQSGAQDWVTTSAPQADWFSIASSADGNKLIAANGEGGVFTSTNGGTNWTPTSAPRAGRLASSANGTKLIVAPSNLGLFYLSINSGATWTPSIVPTNIWLAAASSADGTKVTVVGWGGVLSSSDSGVTWTNYPNLRFTHVASSADGSKLAAAGFAGPKPVHVSTNGGATWSATALSVDNPMGLSCSADGNRLVIVDWAFGGPASIYVSTNFGGTWTPTSAPNESYSDIAVSAEGTKLVVPGYAVWLSTNSGVDWNSIGGTNVCQESCALSADGNRIVIASHDFGCGGLYGASIYIRQSPPAPTLSIRSSDDKLVLSWLVPSLPFSLQTRPDLCFGEWANVQTTPSLNCTNLHYETTFPATAQAAGFYRLAPD